MVNIILLLHLTVRVGNLNGRCVVYFVFMSHFLTLLFFLRLRIVFKIAVMLIALFIFFVLFALFHFFILFLFALWFDEISFDLEIFLHGYFDDGQLVQVHPLTKIIADELHSILEILVFLLIGHIVA